ncbi:MAG: hypothetical protein PHU25_00680 [Deltaproteobacteria bacterium]|nr:hypothetical protein [Deltaproteobacteria bacterium]
MTLLKRTVELVVLFASCFLSLATFGPGPDFSDDDDDGWYVDTDETWVVENVFDGQTAVPRDHVIRLTIGYRDFAGFEAETYSDEVKELTATELAKITLRPRNVPAPPVDFEVKINGTTSVIEHDAFAPNTEYVLDLTGIGNLAVERIIPKPLGFSTTAGPRVTGLWRSDDTLIIAFSERMDPATLSLASDSVDVLWEKDGDLHSIASELNLADFAWKTDGFLFFAASMTPFDEAWIKVDRSVSGESGGLLDGDKDGVPGEAGDDFVQQVSYSTLPSCFTRADIPAPCVTEDTGDLNQEWSTDW